MKDFPFFTTENGVAGLILKEIPYRQEAYIQIRSSQAPNAFLEECVSFCRVCGAEKIYGSGSDILEKYPLHTAIWEMRGTIPFVPEELACLFPVTEETVSRWREIYNRKFRSVPNAGTLEAREEKEILSSGGAYFIHAEGAPLGIGWLREDRIEAIASLAPGAGRTICQTLQSLVPDTQLRLEVASANRKAVALYESLGFLCTAERSRWYCIK